MTAGKRFLVVDDDLSIAEILSTILKYAFDVHDVDIASNAEEALSFLSSCRYDFLLTDHRMPGKTGTTLIREARQIDPSLQVVLITACADTLLMKEISEIGGIGLIVKPFEVVDILRAFPRESVSET